MKNFNPTLYDILGRIPQNATPSDIKKAYRILAKNYHSDLNRFDKVGSDEKMKELNCAYEILSNPIKREEYNAKLREQDEILRKSEEERIKKEEAEISKKKMEHELKNYPKPFNIKWSTLGDGGLVGVTLGIVALGLLIAALYDE